MIPSFRHSEIIFLWFCSVTLVPTARFCSNFHHTLAIRHCMFCRKIGAEGSVLQELCHFVILTARYFCAHFFMIFLCIFSSYCPILFKFSPHLNHTCDVFRLNVKLSIFLPLLRHYDLEAKNPTRKKILCRFFF